VHKAIATFEKQMTAQQKSLEAAYLKLWQKDKKAARSLIGHFTQDVATRQDKLLKQLTTRIAAQLGKGNLTNQQFETMINEIEKSYHFHGA
jgi:hypothetical protein